MDDDFEEEEEEVKNIHIYVYEVSLYILPQLLEVFLNYI